jgi:hypothetical protein
LPIAALLMERPTITDWLFGVATIAAVILVAVALTVST